MAYPSPGTHTNCLPAVCGPPAPSVRRHPVELDSCRVPQSRIVQCVTTGNYQDRSSSGRLAKYRCTTTRYVRLVQSSLTMQQYRQDDDTLFNLRVQVQNAGLCLQNRAIERMRGEGGLLRRCCFLCLQRESALWPWKHWETVKKNARMTCSHWTANIEAKHMREGSQTA